jgi:hypothetical protein
MESLMKDRVVGFFLAEKGACPTHSHIDLQWGVAVQFCFGSARGGRRRCAFGAWVVCGETTLGKVKELDIAAAMQLETHRFGHGGRRSFGADFFGGRGE